MSAAFWPDEFWTGKRVFVTGHTGFKGAWLCACLRSFGAEVIGYSLAPPSEPSAFDICGIAADLAADHRADIMDLDGLRQAMTDAAPDLVMHLAAQTLVGVGMREPVLTFATNITGTAHVLEAARSVHTVRAVVVVTTDKCYENVEWVHPYRETDRLGGHDPYSSSKACAELVSHAYRGLMAADARASGRQKIAVATARAGNVIGGGDWAEGRLVPDCVRAFAAGAEVRLRYPDAVRPWQHVLEPIAGYLMLAARLLSQAADEHADDHAGAGAGAGAEAGAGDGAWNFGPEAGGESSVFAVATEVARIWGDAARVVADPAGGAHREAGLLRLDSTKARVQLGWRPRWSDAEAISKTMAWYRNWHEGGDNRHFMRAQIAEYFQPKGV